MKKSLIFAAFALVVLMFGSCTRFKSANVSVLVKDAGGNPIEGIRVGMFDSDTKLATAQYEKAILKEITDVTGRAQFEITTYEFKLDKKGIFQFIVFNEELEPIVGSPLKSIKTGSSDLVELNLPK